MVLSDSSDSMPPSDNDPYSNSDMANTHVVNFDNMPQPLPIFGQLFGYGPHVTMKKAAEMIGQIERKLGRRFTAEEMDAVVYWNAKTNRIRSYEPVLGIGGGLWRAYDTRQTFRFPFVRPDQLFPTFNKNAFPLTSFPVVRGPTAVIVWHGLRAFSYSAAGFALSKVLISSYASTATTVGILYDSRMTQLTKEMNEILKTGRKMPGQSTPQPSRNQLPQNQDDASPTGGIYGEEDFGKDGPEMVSDNPTPPREQTALNPNPAPRFQQTRWTGETESKPFDYFDDASPTGGQGMSEDTRTSQPQGSAWERIRRGGGVPTQRQGSQDAWSKQRAQAQAGGSPDDFTSTQLSEERRYSKQDAQKEFDARIDRERQGGDFTSNKKW
ncbi:hypothetical protein HYALB_00009897 [Hymenoscyphus albidus]|uniref:Uncharacterized protein n=1 Tax=Hymenoscyphus albidus TaxID=595503 RepID=A0A9N9LPI2_9HELO|nr:hypothetical protein HYALB_00009897 [Hymenoscyphus albidus]